MQHDIYSLGVCLLEIGLWKSFIIYDAHAERTTLSSILGMPANASQDEVKRFLLDSAKRRFIDLARNEVCESMGKEYSEVVEMCLTCQDPSSTFGDESKSEDEYGVHTGVRYIEKVMVIRMFFEAVLADFHLSRFFSD
jgi:hypothetical protein